MQPPYPPPPQPYATKLPVSRTSDLFLKLFGATLGALIFGGLLAWQAVFLVQPPNGVPPGSLADYRNTIYALGWTTAVLLDLAVALSVSLAWIIGMTKHDMPPSTRTALIAFAAIFLAVWILFTSAFFTYFRYGVYFP